MKLPRSLPQASAEEQLALFFERVKGYRDRALFTLMLRCGLRVKEVARLSLGNIDMKRRTLLIQDGKGAKDRMVYLSQDAGRTLVAYLRVRRPRPKDQERSLPGGEGTIDRNPYRSAASKSVWSIMPARPT